MIGIQPTANASKLNRAQSRAFHVEKSREVTIGRVSQNAERAWNASRFGSIAGRPGRNRFRQLSVGRVRLSQVTFEFVHLVAQPGSVFEPKFGRRFMHLFLQAANQTFKIVPG